MSTALLIRNSFFKQQRVSLRPVGVLSSQLSSSISSISTRRTVSSFLTSSPRTRATTRTTRISRWQPALSARQQQAFRRNYSVIEEEKPAQVVDFAEVKKLSETPSESIVIVDVREPEEFKEGHIPSAINIPVKSSPGALGLDNEEFKLTFGFDKPSTEKTLLFYCLAGVRSTMSEELAATFGYTNRLNYTGSWENWVENKGPVEVAEPVKEEPAKEEPAAAEEKK